MRYVSDESAKRSTNVTNTQFLTEITKFHFLHIYRHSLAGISSYEFSIYSLISVCVHLEEQGQVNLKNNLSSTVIFSYKL